MKLCLTPLIEFFLWQKQQEHRIKEESFVNREDYKLSSQGQLWGGALVLICILATVILGITGYEWSASVLGGTTVVSIAAIFIKSNKQESKQSEHKKSSTSVASAASYITANDSGWIRNRTPVFILHLLQLKQIFVIFAADIDCKATLLWQTLVHLPTIRFT